MMITIDASDLQRALRIARMTAKCDCQEKGGDVDNHFATIICNNHDRLVEENAQQRESLDAFRELVKAQTQTMNELNEKRKELAEDNAELREDLQSALNIKNLWLPETNMIVHTEEFCALHKMHDNFKKLL
ncbi:hypothetical protein vBVhaSMAG7_033 [Vibrio phage vB_VhaS_MAG7]|nr:hypothetical protein vBVhaSMAG7_033 [Vibrio phage vB_VhaS_MAG7]